MKLFMEKQNISLIAFPHIIQRYQILHIARDVYLNEIPHSIHFATEFGPVVENIRSLLNNSFSITALDGKQISCGHSCSAVGEKVTRASKTRTNWRRLGCVLHDPGIPSQTMLTLEFVVCIRTVS